MEGGPRAEPRPQEPRPRCPRSSEARGAAGVGDNPEVDSMSTKFPLDYHLGTSRVFVPCALPPRTHTTLLV
eukprot:scaffold78165_cov36-Phaeocystis_antarctica.AAC.1